MCRIVSFVSGAGGVGQTSLIFELSKMLAERNFKVCVFDGHFNLNVISLKFDCKTQADLMDYLSGDLCAEEAVCNAGHNLKVVKTNCITYNYLSHFELIKIFIDKLSESFDYILIDTNSKAKKQLSLALEASNETILLLSDDFYDVRSSAKILQKVYLYENIMSINLVLNKMRVIAEFAGTALGEKEIAEIFDIEPLFVFPLFYKNNIFERAKRDSKLDCLLTQFCESFVRNERYECDYKKQYRGVIGYIRRKLYAKYE